MSLLTDYIRAKQAQLRMIETESEDSEQALFLASKLFLDFGTAMDELKSVQSDAKALVEEILSESGKRKADTPWATIYYTSDSVTVSYDRKALDALMQSNDEYARILQPHRKATTRSGSLVIKGKK